MLTREVFLGRHGWAVDRCPAGTVLLFTGRSRRPAPAHGRTMYRGPAHVSHECIVGGTLTAWVGEESLDVVVSRWEGTLFRTLAVG